MARVVLMHNHTRNTRIHLAEKNMDTISHAQGNMSALFYGYGNMSRNWKLSDRLPFLFGKACYVFRSENALYGTGHIIGRMMIMKTALLLNTL